MKKDAKKSQKNSSSRLNTNKEMNFKEGTIMGIDNETEIDFVIVSDGMFFHTNLQKKTDALTFSKLDKKGFTNWLAN